MSDPLTVVIPRTLQWLEVGDTPTLVAVVASEGSTPGTPGAVMLVGRDGTVGTVGGGSVEHDVIGRARAGDVGLVRWDHTDPESDSLCSGVQTMVLRRLATHDREVLASVVEATSRGGHGMLELARDGLRFEADRTGSVTITGDSEDWVARIPVGLADTLYLAGGGHVSLAVSRVVSTLPFRIVVLDDREGLPTMAANRWAHERRVIRWSEVAAHVQPGPRSWAIVMTAAHAHDRDVLERLLPLELRYLGMLGSRHKVGAVFRALASQGVDAERLASVRAPVGLDIGSHTPAEIAISIAAELVRDRHARDADVTSSADRAPVPRT